MNFKLLNSVIEKLPPPIFLPCCLVVVGGEWFVPAASEILKRIIGVVELLLVGIALLDYWLHFKALLIEIVLPFQVVYFGLEWR